MERIIKNIMLTKKTPCYEKIIVNPVLVFLRTQIHVSIYKCTLQVRLYLFRFTVTSLTGFSSTCDDSNFTENLGFSEDSNSQESDPIPAKKQRTSE